LNLFVQVFVFVFGFQLAKSFSKSGFKDWSTYKNTTHCQPHVLLACAGLRRRPKLCQTLTSPDHSLT
jgi:hypothetical protein